MNKDLQGQFTILKKHRGKLEGLIFEMLFIQEKKPKQNIQSDSIKAKLFSTSLTLSKIHIAECLITRNMTFTCILSI